MKSGRRPRRRKLTLVLSSGPTGDHGIAKERPSPQRARGRKVASVALSLPFFRPPSAADHPAALLRPEPAYATSFGAMVCGDAATAMAALPSDCVDVVITSPPYALHFKKEYGNAEKAAYVEWFRPFAKQVHRVLKPDGSFVLNIGGSYNPGAPTRSLYHFRLLLMLCDEIGFHLAQECFW